MGDPVRNPDPAAEAAAERYADRVEVETSEPPSGLLGLLQRAASLIDGISRMWDAVPPDAKTSIFAIGEGALAGYARERGAGRSGLVGALQGAVTALAVLGSVNGQAQPIPTAEPVQASSPEPQSDRRVQMEGLAQAIRLPQSSLDLRRAADQLIDEVLRNPSASSGVRGAARNLSLALFEKELADDPNAAGRRIGQLEQLGLQEVQVRGLRVILAADEASRNGS